MLAILALALSASAAPYEAYLGCLNRLQRPLTEAVSLHVEYAPTKAPEELPALLFDAKRRGFYFVTPTAVTFDAADGIDGAANDVYPLIWSSETRDRWIYAVVREDRLSEVNASDSPMVYGNLEVNYTPIGTPASLVTDAEEARRALVGEVLPRFEFVKAARAAAEDVGSFDVDLEKALCACARTNRAEIKRAVSKTARELGWNGDQVCRRGGVARL